MARRKAAKDPADFYATIHNEAQLAEFLLIVTSYKPKNDEGNLHPNQSANGE